MRPAQRQDHATPVRLLRPCSAYLADRNDGPSFLESINVFLSLPASCSTFSQVCADRDVLFNAVRRDVDAGSRPLNPVSSRWRQIFTTMALMPKYCLALLVLGLSCLALPCPALHFPAQLIFFSAPAPPLNISTRIVLWSRHSNIGFLLGIFDLDQQEEVRFELAAEKKVNRSRGRLLLGPR